MEVVGLVDTITRFDSRNIVLLCVRGNRRHEKQAEQKMFDHYVLVHSSDECALSPRAYPIPVSPLGNIMRFMTFRVVLESDAVAQAFSAVCPELPGCASAGDTEDEAKRNIKESIELYLAPSDVELSSDAWLDEVTVE